MSEVATVRGPVPAGDLGTVLMHEHVFVVSEEIRESLPETWDEEVRVADAIVKLRALAAAGVDTLVDATAIGLGRNVARVARVNAEVDLNIIVATGVYTMSDVPFTYQYRGPGTLLGGDDPMVDLFVREITEGIADTGIKASFLKCAIGTTLTPGVERVLVAVAEAHKRTGAPITVHTDPIAGSGLVAQEVLRREGVDLGSVVLGHSGDSTDLDQLRRLADNGSYLGMDHFGLEIPISNAQRVATVAALVHDGLADKIVLSQDASCHIDWFPPGFRKQVMPDWRHTYLTESVVPALREAGVSDAQLHTMLVDNPRRYFTGAS